MVELPVPKPIWVQSLIHRVYLPLTMKTKYMSVITDTGIGIPEEIKPKFGRRKNLNQSRFSSILRDFDCGLKTNLSLI